MQRLHNVKKKKLIKNSLCVLIAIFLFVNLNRIISFFFEDSIKLHKIKFADYAESGVAYTYLNELEYHQGGFQEILNCTGWAFAETGEPNDDKSVYLIFKGTRNAYMTGECGSAFSSVQTDVPGWKNIYGKYHNFAINVSTLMLPSDVYTIYVYVEENEHSKGIVNAGRSFKKDGVNLYSYRLGDIVDDIYPDQISNLFDSGWTTLESENDCIGVSGWEAIKDKNSEDSIFYLVFLGNNLKMVTIQMPTIYRTDVGEYLGSNDYIASGFRGALDTKNLPDETGVVYVVAENGGDLYRTEAYSYDINGEEE